jgi:hypothetical protein
MWKRRHYKSDSWQNEKHIITLQITQYIKSEKVAIGFLTIRDSGFILSLPSRVEGKKKESSKGKKREKNQPLTNVTN